MTKPFSFEGTKRAKAAEAGIEDLKDRVDTLILIPNQRILEIVDRNMSFWEAMKKVDDVLGNAVRSISNLITQTGLINVDFADVRSIMTNAGTALMGMGTASGEDRATEAAKQAMANPLLDLDITGAKGVLFNVIGGKDLALHEVDDAAQIIQGSIDSDANVIFGATIDPDLEDSLQITVLATGFDKTEEGASFKRTTGLSSLDSSSQTAEEIRKKDVPNLPKKNGGNDKDDEDYLETPAFLRKKQE